MSPARSRLQPFVSPMKRGLKAVIVSLHIHCVSVTTVSPMKRGLKVQTAELIRAGIQPSYNRFPDEKGTERSLCVSPSLPSCYVTTVSPMKRGLKVGKPVEKD